MDSIMKKQIMYCEYCKKVFEEEVDSLDCWMDIYCPDCGEIAVQHTELNANTVTQKTKTKELIGRTLNSYHTKSLQQIERIETENKRQNHMINVLTNELDNDYLTKTEEGSVISLDHSKEGMVYIDGLEGNTMVNYCTDGEAELTLNGDIDVEGTFVTTADGVDGGKVDIMCEGNTIINLSTTKAETPITCKYKTIEGNYGKLEKEHSHVSQFEQIVTENTTQNTRLNKVEDKNKVQDVYIQGLLNENSDGRLATEVEGNVHKLEGSAKGIAEVESLEGNTFVNCVKSYKDSDFLLYNSEKVGTSFKLPFGSDINATAIKVKNGAHLYKPSTTYTVFVYIENNNCGEKLGLSAVASPISPITNRYRDFNNLTGLSSTLITTREDLNDDGKGNKPSLDLYFGIWKGGGDLSTHITFKYWILEGDYVNTNKPIPSGYIEGLQSSFEDKLVTQEQVDTGLESVENVGKYKAEVELVGKNKFDKSKAKLNGYITASLIFTESVGDFSTGEIRCKPNTTYWQTGANVSGGSLMLFDKYKNFITSTTSNSITTPNNCYYLVRNSKMDNLNTYQIEEGTVATQYEPYHVSKQTLYLNSPLLRGDKLESRKDGVYHVHGVKRIVLDGSESWSYSTTGNYFVLLSTDISTKIKINSVMISDKFNYSLNIHLNNMSISGGTAEKLKLSNHEYKDSVLFKAWLKANPTTVEYELAEPYEEKISDNKLGLECANQSTVQFETIVPIKSVSFKEFREELAYLEASTLYNIAFKAKGAGNVAMNLGGTVFNYTVKEGYNKLTATTPASATNLFTIDGEGITMSELVVSKNEFDGYFEGMCSVGQDDINGHKVEVLSRNKNFHQYEDIVLHTHPNATFSKEKNNISINIKNNVGFISFAKSYTKITPQQSYKIAYESTNGLSSHDYFDPRLVFVDVDKKEIDSPFYGDLRNRVYITPNNAKYICIEWRCRIGTPLGTSSVNNIQIYLSNQSSSYVEPKLNKKEISLSGPLRGLSNGVKDRLIKVGGKWYVERNYICIVYDGITNTMIKKWNQFDTDVLTVFGGNINNLDKNDNKALCDKLPFNSLSSITNNSNEEFVTLTNGGVDEFGIVILKSKLSSYTTEGINEYLKINPITIMCKLKTPTYEPITDPVLITYLDTTHISNNSVIPCNMKVKNSGYNTIIKPSTLYTIALDTNKSETIGLNLGGAKVTTTNNVATITTPLTLTDDSLRVSGKGIKGAKVRLLEGDKTNWIPSMFNGMLSCFEDKKNVDNLYDVEPLSNNENLINYKDISHKNTNYYKLQNETIVINTPNTYQSLYYYIPTKIGERYTIQAKGVSGGGGILVYDGVVKGHMVDSFRGGLTSAGTKMTISAKQNYISIRVSSETSINTDCIFEEILIYNGEVRIDYIPHKSNKIQFSLQEPLRSVNENIKDRWVLIDGKPMIERNIGERTYTGTENWGNYSSKEDVYWIHIDEPDGVRGDICKSRHCLTNKFKRVGSVTFNEVGWSWGDNSPKFYISLDKKELEEYSVEGCKTILQKWNTEGNPLKVTYVKAEPTYELLPLELQKIILEGYENGTLFIDTIIPPTVTTRYAGQTPLNIKLKESKPQVRFNTQDINDNVVPYLCDMDYRVVLLQIQTGQTIAGYKGLSNIALMLERDILSKRYSAKEYRHRINAYLEVEKITQKEFKKLGAMLND